MNLYIPHAFYYSVEGGGSGERLPDVGPNNIWWKHYRRFFDYIKRFSFLDSYEAPRVIALLEQADRRDGKILVGEISFALILNVLEKEY